MGGNSLWSYTYRTYWTPPSGVPGKAIHREVAHQRHSDEQTPAAERELLPLATSLQRPLLTKLNIMPTGKRKTSAGSRSIFIHQAMKGDSGSERR